MKVFLNDCKTRRGTPLRRFECIEENSSEVITRIPVTPPVCNFCDEPMQPLRRHPLQTHLFTQSCTLCSQILHIFTSPTSRDVPVWGKDAKEAKMTVLDFARARIGTRVNEYPAAAPGS